MSIKTSFQSRRRDWLLAAFFLTSFIGLGILGWQDYQESSHSPTAAQVQAEARAGGHAKADAAMSLHPRWWTKDQLAISDLMQLLTADKVSSIGLLDAKHSPTDRPEILVTTREGVLGHVPDNKGEPLAEKVVIAHADKVHVTRVVKKQSTAGEAMKLLLDVVIQLAPLVLMILLVVFQVPGQLRKGFKVQRGIETRFDDVVGVAEAKTALQDIMDFMTEPEHYERVGARPARGVLLSGPPGVGKTHLAKALAGECGVPFIACSGADFVSAYYGFGILIVKRLFATARKQGRAIVFIDEFDGVGQRSSTSAHPTGSELNRIINQFLVEMDGFKSDQRVVVIAATNLVDNIDPALLREGRFDRKIVLGLPSVEEREELFKLYTEPLEMAEEVQYGQLARMTYGLSPAAIASLVNQAAVLAARSRATAVTKEHLATAIDNAYLGEVSGIKMNEAERHRTAVHEAGHAYLIVARKLGKLEKVTVLPRAQALGVTVATHEEHVHLATKEETLHRLDVLLAGRAAEEVLLGSISTGAKDDLKRATELATAMLAQFGFGDRLAALSPEQQRSDSFAQAVNALLETRYQETRTLLAKDRLIIEAIAAKLEADETVDGDEVRALALAA